MIREGSTLVDGDVVVADICVIGGGPAGLALAQGLSGSGLQVLVVEAGSGTPPYRGQPYDAAQNAGLRYYPDASRSRGLGGTAHGWLLDTPVGDDHLRLREMDERDFSSTPGPGRPGWPISRSTLDTYYARARALLGLPPAGPVRVDEDGLEHRQFSYAAASVFTTDVPRQLAADRDVVVLVDTTVTELVSAGAGTPVDFAAARGPAGQAVRLEARTFVLAAGGIENARMLLVSGSGGVAGLGNGSDQVGRCFMEHPHYASGVVMPTDRRLQEQPGLWDVVVYGGAPSQLKFGLGQALREREGLRDVTWFLEPRPASWVVPVGAPPARAAADLAALRRVRRSVASGHRQPGLARDVRTSTRAAPRIASYVVRQRLALSAPRLRVPVVFTLQAMAEQEPHGRSRVRLAQATDERGVPKAELEWRTTAADEESMRRSQELIAPRLARVLGAPVLNLLDPDEPMLLGWGCHHMGTTRMSHRPADGVVDVDCRVHESHNVFVAGSSVFATGGSVNPTLTLVALALRLADHLRRRASPAPAR